MKDFLKTKVGKVLVGAILVAAIYALNATGLAPVADLLKPLVPVVEQPVAE